ncbi:MAG TPA: HAMP domain-containing sensor histidine kinase [Clostridiales bacterium]|nr:HAMP domain-containing sensor histidine kinase [Clostridiales bacterium]
MTEFHTRQYEQSFKVLAVFISFLSVSFILGYYWLLMGTHSSKNSELISELIASYYNENPDNPDKEPKFKHITELLVRSDKTFILTINSNENEIPVVWNMPYLKIKDIDLKKELNRRTFCTISLADENSLKKLYYIPDDLISKMRLYPFFLFLTLLTIVLMAFYLFYYMRRNEKQSVWIAISKETAHQLGTPLTSLKGWREHLHQLGKSEERISSVADGLEEDIEKISLVVNRFSNISSDKEFKMCDTGIIITKAADYISRRLPLESGRIELEKTVGEAHNIYANEVLLEWTFENLLKNAIESLKEDQPGKIKITQYEEKDKIIVEITDNGCGIPSALKKKIFDTGFTTKKRGWGLGLSLSKKIIEQYHGGKLFVKHSGQEGTTMRIELNKFI